MSRSQFTVVQVSDTHLSRSRAYFQDNWDVFVDCMREEKPDRIYVTGDLAVDGPSYPEDLDYAREQMDRLPAPWKAIPGNHDIGDTPPDPKLGHPIDDPKRNLWLDIFGPDFWVENLGDWRFIGLDAQLFESGLVAEEEQREMLEAALADRGSKTPAILCHKPLYAADPEDEAFSLSCLYPDTRRYLLELCRRHGVRLFASGHLHCYRSTRLKGLRQIWCPTTAFVSLAKPLKLKITRRAGYVRYAFDGRQFKAELVEPELFVNLDVTNWQRAHGSTVFLPPRPLNRHAA